MGIYSFIVCIDVYGPDNEPQLPENEREVWFYADTPWSTVKGQLSEVTTKECRTVGQSSNTDWCVMVDRRIEYINDYMNLKCGPETSMGEFVTKYNAWRQGARKPKPDVLPGGSDGPTEKIAAFARQP